MPSAIGLSVPISGAAVAHGWISGAAIPIAGKAATVSGSISEVVPGGGAEGVRAGGRDNYSSDMMFHCATRAHCANPACGGVLHSAPLRCGRDSE